jgi:predicted HTH transcriptional regulator
MESFSIQPLTNRNGPNKPPCDSMKSIIFISSVQKEFQAERRAVADFIRGDPLMLRYFDVFLFEDLPASDRNPEDVYLDAVDGCAVYVGLLGNDYGPEDVRGLSATEKEFAHATAKGRYRIILVKNGDDAARHPKMLALIRQASGQLIRRRFLNVPDLTAQVYASIVDFLEERGLLRTRPFDKTPGRDASLADISEEKLRWFLETARRERKFPLTENTPLDKALAHLDLLEKGKPTHAALLLFGKKPQRFVTGAETKCAHFHGTEVRKPIPSYQVYKGTIFDQVDQAVDFVMSRVARKVTPQNGTPASEVEYELPYKAVREAIVNAIAHRDYTSNAGVQVMLFADRLELWNPGELPTGLTPEKLRQPHASIPHNPLIAEPLFWVRYIERLGTGTLDMIELCRQADLPEPEFRQDGGQWVCTLWLDPLTETALMQIGLNPRQRKAISFLKVNHRITNADYQKLTGAIRKTAARDLDDLIQKDLLQRKGTGRSTHYLIAEKWGIYGTSRRTRPSPAPKSK